MDYKRSLSIFARAISIAGTGVLWYWTYKYIIRKSYVNMDDGFKNVGEDALDSYKVVKMKIPNYAKGAIIGKSGSVIKKIQDRTKTTIKFLGRNTATNDGEGKLDAEWTHEFGEQCNGNMGYEVLTIRGLTLRVLEAEKEIKSIIASVPVYGEESIEIDNRYVGMIIGKRGDNVKRLKETYKVSIDVERSNNPTRRITIRGTSENNALCKKDIFKTIDDEVLREGRPRRYVPNGSAHEIVRQPMEKIEKVFRSRYAHYPGEIGSEVQVLVSSVVDCSQFYAHALKVDDSVKLESLIEDMTNHFNEVAKLDSTTINVDDIAVGYYVQSHTWQRIKIINESRESDLYEVISLDYGDTFKLKRSQIQSFANCQQFLELPFQAIRLVMFGIKPVVDGKWNEDDMRLFRDLTHVSTGYQYPLTCVLKRRTATNLEVQLIDATNDIDIGQELVKAGRALRVI